MARMALPIKSMTLAIAWSTCPESPTARIWRRNQGQKRSASVRVFATSSRQKRNLAWSMGAPLRYIPPISR